ncbi:unnamed protein product [Camellia sinensis]
MPCRLPNTKRLNLEAVGVELDEMGAVKVDEFSRTNVPSIWAVGDVTNRLNLTPVALMEGTCFSKTVFGGQPTKPDYSNVPCAVFCIPPLCVVGLSEEEAIEQAKGDISIFTSTFNPMKNTVSGNLRQEKKVMKLVVDSETDKVIGASMCGPDAPEIMQLSNRVVHKSCTMVATVGLFVLFVLGTSWACDARELTTTELSSRETVISDVSVLQINHQESEGTIKASEEVGRNENVCTLCEEFAAKAIEYLEDNKTQTEMIDILHNTCARLIPIEQKIELLQPEDFCQTFYLCEQRVLASQSLAEDKCEIFHLAISEVIVKLKDPDTQSLLSKSSRESLGVNLKNDIVIIDEAYNLADSLVSMYDSKNTACIFSSRKLLQQQRIKDPWKMVLQAGGVNLPGVGTGPTITAETPTKVLCLTELITADELMDDGDYEEILVDMREEEKKFGVLVNVIIPRPSPNGGEQVPGVGKMQYGSIGWAVGVTLGYGQVARNKRVIAFIGDGSFQVTAQDVSTMLRCEQRTIIFLIEPENFCFLVDAFIVLTCIISLNCIFCADLFCNNF